MNGIVVIEGADSAGKTTLARYLIERYDARYLHSTIRKDVWRWHAGALRHAIELSRDRLVILDRHWLSELAYGSVFRTAPAYDVSARCFDRILRRFGAVYVLCVPSDQKKQEERWATNRENGKHEHFDRVREVINLYADLRHGNLAHPGSGYLDQLIRFQDFTARDDVLIYDIDVASPRTLSAKIKEKLANLSGVMMVRSVGGVSGRDQIDQPSVLFVGETPSPASSSWSPRIPVFPWVDNDAHLSAATWLNQAVHHLALREDRMVFTNADAPALIPLLYLTEANPQSRIVALGKVAARTLRSLRQKRVIELPHPQWHRRFRYGEGPAGFAQLLSRALV